ncbi:hypothetical protein AFLA_007182 [Aspergillus flavus NRRL3357]|nr:hypothetical protein AFLA_007182 [Aspergillus flavus NRRL3357]
MVPHPGYFLENWTSLRLRGQFLGDFCRLSRGPAIGQCPQGEETVPSIDQEDNHQQRLEGYRMRKDQSAGRRPPGVARPELHPPIICQSGFESHAFCPAQRFSS